MLSQPQIIALIDALISAKYLRLTGGDLPVLTLNPLGQQALEVRAALPVRIPGLSVEKDVIERWQTRSGRSDTVMQTFALLKEGLSPTQIAVRRKLAEDTIYTHLARLIGDGQVELHQVVPPEIEAQVAQAIMMVENTNALSPLKAILPAEISYGQIKCVITAYLEGPEPDEAPTPAKQAAGPTEAQTKPAQSTTTPAPAPSSSPAPDQAPDAIILEAVAKLGGTLGRTGLAQFLTGSRANWLENFSNHSYYGQLSHLSQKGVINIIDALITDGRLLTTGGGRPKVVLPDQPDPPLPSPVSIEPQPELEPNQTLLRALRSWRANLAERKRVASFIILNNKVLEAIATQQPTTLAKLRQISGIGHSKLRQYGEAVIAIVAETLDQLESSPQPSTSPQSAQPRLKEEPQNQNQGPKPVLPITSTAARPHVDWTGSRSAHSLSEVEGSKIQNPVEIILTLVSDLDALLTVEGLAQLLTAAPGEVVPFSDHELFGTFHGHLSFDDILVHIEETLQSGRLSLSPYQRLTL